MPKRDMDLVRAIVLHVEALEPGVYDNVEIAEEIAGETISVPLVEYHINLLIRSQIIAVTGKYESIIGLTKSGHDFADSVRDEGIWRKTRDGAASAGGWTFDLLKDLAKGFLKKQIESKTGVTF